MRQFGKFLQVLALVLAPVALFMPHPAVFRFPGPEFSVLIMAACIFFAGRLIEGYAR